MREIKFRAWDSVLNEYRKLDMNSGKQNLGMGFEVMGGIDSNITTIYHSVGDVIEQYTCLKDKNGVDICESDIVHAYDQEPDRYEPDYRGSEATGIVEFHGSMFMLDDDIILNYPPILEVIGNIYENENLL